MKGRRLGEVSLGRLLAGSQNCRNEVLKRRQKNDVVIIKERIQKPVHPSKIFGLWGLLKNKS